MDPYVVLGVDRVASPDEIDAAYARRRRLHDPATQTTEAERSAAEVYHAELADAYQALLGTTPPETSDDGVGRPGSMVGRSTGRGTTAVRPTKRAPSPGRDALVVLGTLVGAYVVIQVPVALGFGFGGLIVGFVAAIALVAVALAHEHGRRT
ncbi:MAG: J domain-containing protein [Acidimicrobiia bacterium]